MALLPPVTIEDAGTPAPTSSSKRGLNAKARIRTTEMEIRTLGAGSFPDGDVWWGSIEDRRRAVLNAYVSISDVINASRV